VGGVSGRPARERAQRNLRHVTRDATVEGTQAHGMPAPFAGRRGNVGLGRSVHRSREVSSSVIGRTGDKGCPLEAAGGERRRRARSARTRPGGASSRTSSFEDTSFTRSRDPCSSIVTSSFGSVERRRWSGVTRPFRYCGRANSRKREEPAPGSGRSDGRAARRVSPLRGETRRSPRDTLEKEEGPGLRPCEETRAPVWCSYVVSSCRSRQAVSDLEYARTQRSKKSGGGSERGSSRRRGRRAKAASRPRRRAKG
jgi:hypothetical protein